jgi:hypothetical protein
LGFLKQNKKFKFILKPTRVFTTLALSSIYKVACPKKKLGSERKCEVMNPHTPKGASTLGVGVLMDSRMFTKKFQDPKLNGLRSYLYH